MNDDLIPFDIHTCEDSNRKRRKLVEAMEQSEFGRTANASEGDEGFSPTQTVCAELQYLYDTFNERLFDGELPECLMTLDVTGRTRLGFFKPDAFTTRDGMVIDQIALNAKHLITRPMRDVAGTVAHEMAHLWMHRCSGKRVTSGYHCRVWGHKMESIGLMPSNTGDRDGRKTGYQMTHYPIAGGPFLGVVSILEEEGFTVTWGYLQSRLEKERNDENSDKTKGKIKLVCPECHQTCWGAASLELICGKDGSQMLRELP